MNLVVHQVRQLEHVDVAHGDGLFEFIARHAIVQDSLAGSRQTCPLEQRLDFVLARAVKHRRSREHSIHEGGRDRLNLLIAEFRDRVGERRILEQSLQFPPDGFRSGVFREDPTHLLAHFKASPPKMRFQNLADVHTARHAQGIQNDFHRRPVVEVRHILFRQDAGNYALVPVTAGHLVSDA